MTDTLADASPIDDLNTIQSYFEYLGPHCASQFPQRQAQLQPQAALVDFSRLVQLKHHRSRFGFYGIFYKPHVYGPITYGRSQYDYEAGTIMFIAPGQVAGIDDNKITKNPEGMALLFSPEFLAGSKLAEEISDYHFFAYSSNEALHMSDRERELILRLMQDFGTELDTSGDDFSHDILLALLETILKHCQRFYARQFQTRQPLNHDVLSRFERLMQSYFSSEQPEIHGLPTVAWCAEQLHFSANYFGDLIKNETGFSVRDYIHKQVIARAKEQLIGSSKNISEIAFELGLQYPHHLSRLFKKEVGCTPQQYRSQHIA